MFSREEEEGEGNFIQFRFGKSQSTPPPPSNKKQIPSRVGENSLFIQGYRNDLQDALSKDDAEALDELLRQDTTAGGAEDGAPSTSRHDVKVDDDGLTAEAIMVGRRWLKKQFLVIFLGFFDGYLLPLFIVGYCSN